MVLENSDSGLVCNRCGKNSVITDQNTDERFCGKCGYVIPEVVQDTGPEWRSFSKDGPGQDPTRTGSPTSLAMHDRGLSTNIGLLNKDSSGKPLSSSMKSTIERLRTWDSRSKANSSSDRNLRQALGELSALKDKLTLTDAVIEKASYIYRKANEKNLVRGRSISAMLAASLYAACRDAETPRTLNDLSESANIKRKDIARCYRLLYRELDLKMPVVDSVFCISRIASSLDIPEKTRRHAINIIRETQEQHQTAGKDPMGLAAAALYMACVEHLVSCTQKEIALASNVTEVTIRNRYKGLRTKKN